MTSTRALLVKPNRPTLALRALLPLVFLASASQSWSTPFISQVTGTLDHKASITITGSGFGSKASAAPLVWDDATGTDIKSLWDDAWPNAVPGYNTGYYSPMRGTSPPHSHDARYIAGAHATSIGAYSGYAVLFYKSLPLRPFPFYLYASWYQLADPQWIFGGDNNYKTFDYSNCCDPYAAANWYVAYGPPHPASTTDSAQWTINDDTGNTTFMNPDVNGHNFWWGPAVNPMAGQWSKVEMAIKVTNQTDGYVKTWENGKLVVNYAGPTDKYPGTSRVVAIGGYARMQFTSNWRFYDDAYIDTTLSRVVLADKPVLSQASIIEVQIPTAWSDGSISATVNLGKFSQSQTAYLFVVDSNGVPNAAGVAVTAGGGAIASSYSTVPSPPSSVSVH